MVKFEHFSYLEKYKIPVGGLQLGSPLILRITSNVKLESIILILTKDSETPIRYSMNEICTNNKDLTFEVTVQITSVGLYFYHFEIQTEDGLIIHLGRDEFFGARQESFDDWHLIVFYKSTFSKSPISGGIIYQIMTDRFCHADKPIRTKNYAVYRNDWQGVPFFGEGGTPITNTDFFGGNLKGIISKLKYLSELNITAIYLNPIFEAHSNHKYDTGNYLKIDPDFGTEEDFKELINRAKEYNIGIILDGVFSHTGDDSIYFNKYANYDSLGAYESKNSPYYEWYSFNEFPDKYACWWGIDTLPNVNENNKHYTEFICGQEGVLRHWTKKGVIGWRLDVADELPDEFLENIYRAVKKENPNSIIIGEVWENAATKISYGKRRRYFLGGQLDSVTNYPLKEAIIKFIKGCGSNELRSVILGNLSTYPTHALNNAMNILSTHDTIRISTVFGKYQDISTRESRATAKNIQKDESNKKLMLAAVLQFTLPGVPCIYYGDEIGLEGFEDPFNRKCYPWNKEDAILLAFYKTLGKIRTVNNDVFADGKIEILTKENEIFAFKRFNNKKEIIIIVNPSNNNYFFDITDDYADLLSEEPFCGNVPPQTAVILEIVIYNTAVPQ